MPAVAGTFYPRDRDELAGAVDSLLGGAARSVGVVSLVKAIISPHAGYPYSGATAATAFSSFGGVRDDIERVVVFGPSHRVAVDGLALSGAEAFRTPLGDLAVDIDAVGRLERLRSVSVNDDAHAAEHSIEVQLPFVQTVFPSASIVPVAVGAAAPDDVARAYGEVWGGPRTVIVASSDLSHYHDYAAARRLDASTADSIVAGDVAAISLPRACGALPVAGLVAAAAQRGLIIECLELCNSGDTAGSRDRVVGYGAFSVSAAA